MKNWPGAVCCIQGPFPLKMILGFITFSSRKWSGNIDSLGRDWCRRTPEGWFTNFCAFMWTAVEEKWCLMCFYNKESISLTLLFGLMLLYSDVCVCNCVCVCVCNISDMETVTICFLAVTYDRTRGVLSGYVVMASTNDKAELGKTFLFGSVVVPLWRRSKKPFCVCEQQWSRSRTLPCVRGVMWFGLSQVTW